MKEMSSAAALCLVALGAIAESVPSAAPSAPITSSPSKTPVSTPTSVNAEKAIANSPPTLVPTTVEPGATKPDEGTEYFPKFLGLHLKITDTLLAVFTLGLAVATIGLWKSTKKLWEAGERQAALTLKEFHDVNRPRLLIRGEKIASVVNGEAEGPRMGIEFVLVNVGKLRATNIEANFNIQIASQDTFEEYISKSYPPYTNGTTDVGQLIIKPPNNSKDLDGDQRAYIFVPADRNNDPAGTWQGVLDGLDTLFFFGYLTFNGPDGVRRQSAFFRRYDREERKFIPRKNDDYEYH